MRDEAVSVKVTFKASTPTDNSGGGLGDGGSSGGSGNIYKASNTHVGY